MRAAYVHNLCAILMQLVQYRLVYGILYTYIGTLLRQITICIAYDISISQTPIISQPPTASFSIS